MSKYEALEAAHADFGATIEALKAADGVVNASEEAVSKAEANLAEKQTANAEAVAGYEGADGEAEAALAALVEAARSVEVDLS